MPTIRLTTDTMRLICGQRLPGFDFLSTARRRPDGDWDVPVDDEVAYTIAKTWLPGESDDDVVARLVRAAAGTKPDWSGRLYFAPATSRLATAIAVPMIHRQ